MLTNKFHQISNKFNFDFDLMDFSIFVWCFCPTLVFAHSNPFNIFCFQMQIKWSDWNCLSLEIDVQPNLTIITLVTFIEHLLIAIIQVQKTEKYLSSVQSLPFKWWGLHSIWKWCCEFIQSKLIQWKMNIYNIFLDVVWLV